MKIRSVFLSVFLFVLLFASFAGAVDMPRFSLPDVLSGKEINSKAFAGKTLLITFFATWCPPCRMEVPELKQLQQRFAGEDFSVVGFSVDNGELSRVAAFVKKEAINYPVLKATYSTGRDFGGVFGIPTAFLINKAGAVVKRYQGFVHYEILEKDISNVMQ